MEWLPWGGAAFARARAERKPVLLSIVAPWSAGCAEMDRVSYNDAATAAFINEHVIAVRVDADHRPDLADRYDLGGLPTTAFLTADGQLLGGGTFVLPERLRAAVSKVAAAGGALSPAGQAAAQTPDARLPVDDAALLDLIFAAFDEEHGGFGTAPKFPLVAPVRLALDLYAEQQIPEMRHRAVRTLDAMGWGALYDEEHGGFFRCAERADWSAPQREKLLATNAALLDLYLHAGTVLGDERWFARAVDLVGFIHRALASPAGGWRTCEGGDGTRIFCDANALAVSAMLRAAALFQDDALGRRALDGLERVLLASYKPGDGVGHSADGARGLLGDQVAMAAANLDAWESTGNVVYRMMAEELMHYALRTMWDQPSGGFFARVADDTEPSGCASKPFLLNCEAAVVLHRAGQAAPASPFAARAVDALDAIGARAAEFGPLAAAYLIARRALGSSNRQP